LPEHGYRNWLSNYNMKAYFISGLGADRTVFRNIKLPESYEPVYLDWIRPELNESLTSYARRLSAAINPAEPFVLIGLSFGGMLAVEISKILKPVQTIIISSIQGVQDLPSMYKWAGRMKLQKLVPVSFFKQASIIKRLFTAESKEDKFFLREMIRKTDPGFIKWAMNAILQWDNTYKPFNCVHIHGSQDGILPLKCTSPTHIIPRGGHMMIMNRAGEINKIIAEILK
jgi:pimeloyl-ACP methyl ester carboxylesterase